MFCAGSCSKPPATPPIEAQQSLIGRPLEAGTQQKAAAAEQAGTRPDCSVSIENGESRFMNALTCLERKEDDSRGSLCSLLLLSLLSSSGSLVALKCSRVGYRNDDDDDDKERVSDDEEDTEEQKDEMLLLLARDDDDGDDAR